MWGYKESKLYEKPPKGLEESELSFWEINLVRLTFWGVEVTGECGYGGNQRIIKIDKGGGEKGR